MDGYLRRHERAFLVLPDVGHPVSGVERGADGNRGQQAEAVRAVVDDVLLPGDLHVAGAVQGWQEAEGEEAVGDRPPERAGGGALHVDVDPLVVAGQLCELVHLLLGHLVFGTPGTPLLGDGPTQALQVVVGDFRLVAHVVLVLALSGMWLGDIVAPPRPSARTGRPVTGRTTGVRSAAPWQATRPGGPRVKTRRAWRRHRQWTNVGGGLHGQTAFGG